MKTIPGVAKPEQLFRELAPGETFQLAWMGNKLAEYATTDLTRAAPDSDQPWDFRAALNLETGEVILLPPTLMVAPTDMVAGPA